jgi:hypothetical protein
VRSPPEAHIGTTLVVGVRVVEMTLPASNFVLISYRGENHYICNAARRLGRIATQRYVCSELPAKAPFTEQLALHHGRPGHSARRGEATHFRPWRRTVRHSGRFRTSQSARYTRDFHLSEA